MLRKRYRIGWVVLLLAGLVGVTGCVSVPDESVALSNTVGRDIEEMHRAHRALAELHFGRIEQDINHFVDETYRPAFIRKFAEEFDLNGKVAQVLERDTDKLLPVLARFVEVATSRVEDKRASLLGPVQAQRRAVIADIDEAYRQIQSAQAVVTGHLASVRKVREVQNEALAKAGLGDLRQRIATTTAGISEDIAGLVEKGRQVEDRIDSAADRIAELDERIEAFRTSVSKSD